MTVSQDCAHERVGPLPYDGRSPDPEEFECLDCGHWSMKLQPPLPRDDVFGDPWETGWEPGWAVPSLSVRDLEELIARTHAMPPVTLGLDLSDPASNSISFMTVGEALKAMGATVELRPLSQTPRVFTKQGPTDIRVTLRLEYGDYLRQVGYAQRVLSALPRLGSLTVELVATTPPLRRGDVIGAFYDLRGLVDRSRKLCAWRLSRRTMKELNADAYAEGRLVQRTFVDTRVLGVPAHVDDSMGDSLGLVMYQ